jgi:hypothetical protein
VKGGGIMMGTNYQWEVKCGGMVFRGVGESMEGAYVYALRWVSVMGGGDVDFDIQISSI